MNRLSLPKAFDGLDFDCRTPCEEQDEKPPPNKALMGISSGHLPADGFVVRRLQNIWELLAGDWDIPVARGIVSSRRLLVLKNLQE